MMLLDEKTQGSKAGVVNDIIEKLTKTNWYRAVGKKNEGAKQAVQSLLDILDVSDCKIKWVDPKKLADTIDDIRLDGSSVWEKLKELPDQLKMKIDEKGEGELLEAIVDLVPEVIFHRAYECAFDKFKEEKLVKFFVVQAMYFALLICSAEIAGETELAENFLNVIGTGNIPVGPKDNLLFIV